MRKLPILLFLWMLLILEGTSQAELPVDSFCSLSVGYRCDDLHVVSLALGPDGGDVMQNQMRQSELDLLEVGIVGGLTIDSNWLTLARISLGDVFDGHYKESGIEFIEAATRAKIRSGISVEASIGSGYLFPLSSWMRIGPMAGWSFSALNTKTSHVTVQEVDCQVSYKNRWQGPWLGAAFTTCLWGCGIYAEYEYHWSEWSARWVPNRNDLYGVLFADQRHSTHGVGQVGRVGANYAICENWSAALEFCYRFWRTHDGSIRPRSGSFTEVGALGITSEKVDRSSWSSVIYQLAISREF